MWLRLQCPWLRRTRAVVTCVRLLRHCCRRQQPGLGLVAGSCIAGEAVRGGNACVPVCARPEQQQNMSLSRTGYGWSNVGMCIVFWIDRQAQFPSPDR